MATFAREHAISVSPTCALIRDGRPWAGEWALVCNRGARPLHAAISPEFRRPHPRCVTSWIGDDVARGRASVSRVLAVAPWSSCGM